MVAGQCAARKTRGQRRCDKIEHGNATPGQDQLMRYVELRRHTGNDGDRLTPQGAADAEAIGRGRLHPPYAGFVSTGAARVTQMAEILRHAAGQDEIPITSATGLRSSVEDRWRQAAKAAGQGADLDAMRAVGPDLDAMRAVGPDLAGRESFLLASALRQVVEGLPEGGRGAGGRPQPHQRGCRARAGRPGRPPGGQGPRGPADRGRRRVPAGTIGLNGCERSAGCAASNGDEIMHCAMWHKPLNASFEGPSRALPGQNRAPEPKHAIHNNQLCAAMIAQRLLSGAAPIGGSSTRSCAEAAHGA